MGGVIRAGVFIGVDRVGGDLPELKDAVAGAERMHAWASRAGIASELVTDRHDKVTVDRVYDAVQHAVGTSGLDQLIVYFAGHGYNRFRREQWLLSDAPMRGNAAIDLAANVEIARYCGVRHVVFVSDACRVPPQGLQAQNVNGVEILPNDAVSASANPVDQFLACQLGKVAIEARDPALGYRALYTTAVLDAVEGRVPKVFAPHPAAGDDALYLLPRALRNHLRDAVPTRILGLGLLGAADQEPDAIITSENEWLARLDSVPAAPSAPSVPSMPSMPPVTEELPAQPAFEEPQAVQVQPPGSGRGGFFRRLRDLLPGGGGDLAPRPTPPVVDPRPRPTPPTTGPSTTTNAGIVIERATPVVMNELTTAAVTGDVSRYNAMLWALGTSPRAQLASADIALLTSEWPAYDFGGAAGLRLRGATLRHVVPRRAPADRHAGGQAARIRLGVAGAEPVAVVLGNGTCCVVPVLPGMVTGLTWDDGELLDVSFEPTRTPADPRVRALRAVAAASMRRGRFDLESLHPVDVQNAISTAGNADPALALYAAYAYYDLQREAEIAGLSAAVLAARGTTLFDLELLARRAPVPGDPRILVGLPLLSQGWSLLRALRTPLDDRAVSLQDEVLDSVWSLYSPRAADRLVDLVRSPGA
ncbi:caspase family protein [Nocardioides speluncae]|uniref:caspase family protein n=1 Tax=Nocardioides speluncae TaxID=2670337 RepID=UPI000D69E92B|nr:caspase family protein [Nocardioides speluncae]